MHKPVLLIALFGTVLVSLPPHVALGQAEDEHRLTSEDLAGWLDDRFARVWRQKNLKPPPVVDDATFLRRAYLDLAGTIPSVATTRSFLGETAPGKRAELVDALLDGREMRFTDRYTAERNAEHLARIWRRILVPPDSPQADMAARLDPWLEEQFAENVPYDRLAQTLVAAVPDTAGGNAQPAGAQAGPVLFYRAVGNSPPEMAAAVSRVFLGVRIECAQCHDHPFAEWTQDDFWGMAAFFTDEREGITAGDSGMLYPAKFLGGRKPDLDETAASGEVLARWMVSPQNRNFAATAVNRVWQHLCGRALVGDVADLDMVSDETRSLLLDDFADKFVHADYDLVWLMKGICKSKVYQRESRPGQETSGVHWTGRPLKTLTPEQVFHALEQALALPVSNNENSPRHNGQRAQLVARLSETVGSSPDQFRGGIPQTLLLMNGKLVSDATSLRRSRTLRAVVDAPFLEAEEKIETLYLAAFTRRPHADELHKFLDYIRSRGNERERREAYAEIFWGLLNSPEFVLSR